MPVTKAQIRKVALGFPGALEKLSYGQPAFFIEKKFLTRLREQDASIVMRVGSMEQRDMMLELDPETYFITDHYRAWPVILVRIAKITPTELAVMLERRWREIAPKKLLREADGAEQPAKKPAAKKAAVKTPAKRKAPARKVAPARTKAKKSVKARSRAR